METGSSATIMRGRKSMARAMTTRCCWAAAEHMGKSRQDVVDRGQPYFFHHFVNAIAAAGFVEGAVDFQGLGENAANIHEGRKRAEGILLHVADLGAVPLHFFGVE